MGAGWVALIHGAQFMHCSGFWMLSFTHSHSLGIICCHCSSSKLTLWAGLHRWINEHVGSWEVLGWYSQIVLLNWVETFLVENTVTLFGQVLCFMRLGFFFPPGLRSVSLCTVDGAPWYCNISFQHFSLYPCDYKMLLWKILWNFKVLGGF